MSSKPKNTEAIKVFQIKKYWPLIILIMIAFLASLAIVWRLKSGTMDWMHYFMGILLCLFAMLKLFNLSGFADGFQMYDLLAKKSREYALFYPFLELGLGLAYLAFIFPTVTYSVTIAVMGISILGVIAALKRGLNVSCACMGTVLEVPLSTVTLTEDLGMGLMAACMLVSQMNY
jgi:hypothetical protein